MRQPQPVAEFDQLLTWLYGVFNRLVGDPEDARDLTHDCALRFLQRLAEGAEFRSSEAMLRVMARNMAIDHYRRRALREIPIAEMAPGTVTEVEARVAPWLRGVIAEMPDKYGRPLLWSDLDGIPQAQIAERLGLSLSGTKSRIQRARRMLADRVRQHCELEFDGEGRLAECIPKSLCCDS